MVNIDKLRKRIDESGMPMTRIAERSGIVRETLYNRLNGVGEFTATEIMALTQVLRLNRAEREAIFFAKEV